MASKKSKKKRSGKVGTPIYDDYGRIIGFEGSPEFSKPVDISEQLFSMIPPQQEEATPSIVQDDQITPELIERLLMADSGEQQQVVQKQPGLKEAIINLFTPDDTPSNFQMPEPGSAAPNTWESFVQQVAELAPQYGVNPAIILGQAAIETGRNPNSAPGNNWFGIKGYGSAGTQNLATKEESGGQMYSTNANFAKFSSIKDAIESYLKLLERNFPEAWAARQNPEEMVQHLRRYATDSNYISKVSNTPEFKAFARGQAYGTPAAEPTRPQPGYSNLLDDRTEDETMFQDPKSKKKATKKDGALIPTWQRFINNLNPMSQFIQPAYAAESRMSSMPKPITPMKPKIVAPAPAPTPTKMPSKPSKKIGSFNSYYA